MSNEQSQHWTRLQKIQKTKEKILLYHHVASIQNALCGRGLIPPAVESVQWTWELCRGEHQVWSWQQGMMAVDGTLKYIITS